MDQKKIGIFLKSLRIEKNLTQEQLAEKFNVSNRTISRWETGSNMPDLSILTEISDFYDVDIREIIDGERKSEKMDNNKNNETKEILTKVAEYSNTEKKILKKKLLDMSLGTLIIFIFYILLEITNGFGTIPERPCQNMKEFALIITTACLILNSLYLCGFLDKIKKLKSDN